MRSAVMCGAGVVCIALIATACGSADKTRAAFDGGGAGAGGQGEAGASDAPGGSRANGEAGAAAGSGPAAGGASGGSAPGDGAAPGDGGAAGNFVPPPPRLALGGPHSCALRLDETVACWGRGDHGELGDGEFHFTPPSTPMGLAEAVAVEGLEGIAAIASGLSHSCALLSSDASVLCWGGGNAGQLGDGVFHTFDDFGQATPLAVAVDNVIQVSAAGNNTCVLSSDTTVQCWGDNLFGQLGNDSVNDSATPVAVSGLSGVAQIAVGKFQTCALLDDASVQCWGSGGVDNQAGTGITLLTPMPIAGLTGVTALAAGDDFTCALVAGGEVRCWGEGNVGQLGNGEMLDSNTTPVNVTGLSGIVQLSAGGRHVCALAADQAVWCWGDGEFGQLGDGVFHNGFPYYVTEPVAAELLTDVVEVECGETHTCVRTSADEVLCVGAGNYGQLGDGNFYATLPFGSATPVTALAL